MVALVSNFVKWDGADAEASLDHLGKYTNYA